MKSFYVILLMGAAAVGGGLLVRYSDRPVELPVARSLPPAVVAPPIPPTAHVRPSNSVPARLATPETRGTTPDTQAETLADASTRRVKPDKPVKAEKPSALSAPVHLSTPDPVPPAPRIVARVIIPPEPPAVTPLERSTVASRVPMAVASPSPVPAVAPTPAAPAVQPAPEPNHATLKAGMLISVRIGQALSSNLNSPGDVFSGTLDKPLIADGFVIAERGAQVRGEVVDSKSAGRGQGLSELSLRLREILASDGQRAHVVSEPWRKVGSVSTGYDAGIRSVYDGALTRGGAAVIRPATRVTFRLDQTVELTERR